MKNTHKFLAVLLLLGIASCSENEKKDDQVNSVDKSGAVETELSIQHLDSADVLVTKYKIWKDQNLVKELVKKDTIPALGNTSEYVENQQGITEKKEIRKDYEFFITVQ